MGKNNLCVFPDTSFFAQAVFKFIKKMPKLLIYPNLQVHYLEFLIKKYLKYDKIKNIYFCKISLAWSILRGLPITSPSKATTVSAAIMRSYSLSLS